MNHTHYMSLALQLAEQGRLTVSPNPMVGCVIVKNNQIVGQGFHQRAGEAHAEIIALQQAGEQAKDASLYVTLEPCCHQGRTPPCTLALIKAGIKQVYIASVDPNPLVAGKGIDLLRAAGIQVETGFCKTEAIALNEIFFHYIKYRRPFVIAKWAMSLDGKTAVHQNDTRQISDIESQQHTHQLRQQVDAILVGANTLQLDNPQLTARYIADNSLHAKQPIRIILAGHIPLSPDLALFNVPAKIIIAVTEKNKSAVAKINAKHIETWALPESKDGKIDLLALLNKLGKAEISSLLVEGGMTVHESFFRENLVNKIHVYLSPVLIGGLAIKKNIHLQSFSEMGKDFHFVAQVE